VGIGAGFNEGFLVVAESGMPNPQPSETHMPTSPYIRLLLIVFLSVVMHEPRGERGEGRASCPAPMAVLTRESHLDFRNVLAIVLYIERRMLGRAFRIGPDGLLISENDVHQGRVSCGTKYKMIGRWLVQL
jgi:hypothetical protein